MDEDVLTDLMRFLATKEALEQENNRRERAIWDPGEWDKPWWEDSVRETDRLQNVLNGIVDRWKG